MFNDDLMRADAPVFIGPDRVTTPLELLTDPQRHPRFYMKLIALNLLSLDCSWSRVPFCSFGGQLRVHAVVDDIGQHLKIRLNLLIAAGRAAAHEQVVIARDD